MARYSRQGATLLGVVTIVLGFGAIALSWVGAAATLFIPTQVAYAVSGGVVGIALIGIGAAVLDVQVDRVLAAERSRQREDLIDAAVELLGSTSRSDRT